MLRALAKQHCPVGLEEAVETLQGADQAGHYPMQTCYVIKDKCAEGCGAVALSGWSIGRSGGSVMNTPGGKLYHANLVCK